MVGQDGSGGQADPHASPEGALMGARNPLAFRGSPMGALQPRGAPSSPGDDSREAEDSGVRPKILQALKKILQLKERCQEELVIVPGVAAEDEMETQLWASVSASEAKDDTETSEKKWNQKRRDRKKKKWEKGGAREGPPNPRRRDPEALPGDDTEVEVEYVIEEPEIYDPNFVFFKRTFEAFKLTGDVNKDKEELERTESARALRKKGPEDGTRGSDGDSSDDEQEKKQEVPKLSKKKLRRMNRLTVAELKQLVVPDVVEMHDVTAQDPQLLVHLKATRNLVPVPRLVFKRKYLQGKRASPNLRISGLNSPIPEGCLFGYYAGAWGKPPVDTGKPLYGDVFGTNAAELQTKEEEEEEIIDCMPWGELEPSDEESEEDEEDSDEEKHDETGFITPADRGLIIPGGFSLVPTGLETSELIELRKKKIEEAMGTEIPQLFTVVPEKRTATVGTVVMGSTHIYDVSAVMERKGPGTEGRGVELALIPEELELDPRAMSQKYEEHVREQQAQVEKEDFSDMVAEHAAKQKQKKRKAQPHDACEGGKKYKEFKF
ncbi:LOW QUALITY PROTEIN: splicing factor 3B subunit 2 [Acridotheres tristis]